MEQWNILLLIGIVWFDGRSTPTAEDLSAPVLSPDRSFPVYLLGERLEVSCVAPEGVKGRKFSLMNASEPAQPLLTYRAAYWSRFVTFDLGPLIHSVGESYFMCSYLPQQRGEGQASTPSEILTATIVDRPRRPELRLNGPHQVYVRSEPVSVTCATHESHGEVRFQLSADREREGGLEGSAIGSFTFNLSGSQVFWRVFYTCVYTAPIAGRPLTSDRSRPLKVIIEQALLTPYLRFDGFPKVFASGERPRLQCQGYFADRKSRFSLWRGKKRVPLAHMSPVDLTFHVIFRPRLRLGNQSFSCGYTRVVSKRPVSSPRSKWLTVMAIEPLLAPSLRRLPMFWDDESRDSIVLVCDSGLRSQPMGFTFRRKGLAFAGQSGLQGTGEGMHRLVGNAQTLSDNYTCSYSSPISGRWFVSPHSLPLSISPTDFPIRPRKPNAELVGDWNVGGRDGEFVGIVCESPSPGRDFLLFQGEGSVPARTARAETWNFVMIFDLGHMPYLSMSTFSCAYWGRRGDRKVLSHLSDPVGPVGFGSVSFQ